MRCSTVSAVALATLALAAISRSAHGQVLDGRQLPVGTDTFVVSYGGSVIGRGVMSRSRISDAELLQVYEWQSSGGDRIVDSLLSQLRSIRPIREVRLIADTVIEATFAADSVRVVTRTAGRQTRTEAIAAGGGLYSSASLESLVAAAPLTPGYDQQLRLYYAPPSPHGIQLTRVQVSGSERVVTAGMGTRDAWVATASTPGGGTTFWIDKATRAILKYDTREGPATIAFRR